MAVSVTRSASGNITVIVRTGGRTYRIPGGNRTATADGVRAALRHAARGGLPGVMERLEVQAPVAVRILSEISTAMGNAAALARTLGTAAPRPPTPPVQQREGRGGGGSTRRRRRPVRPPPTPPPEPPPEEEEEEVTAPTPPRPPPPERRQLQISTQWLNQRLSGAGGDDADEMINDLHGNMEAIDTYLGNEVRARGALAFVLQSLAQVPRFRLFASSQAPPEIARIIGLAAGGTLTARHLVGQDAAAVQFIHDYLEGESRRTGTSEAAQAARRFGTEAGTVAEEIPDRMGGALLTVAALYVRRMQRRDAEVWHPPGTEVPIPGPLPEEEDQQVTAEEIRERADARISQGDHATGVAIMEEERRRYGAYIRPMQLSEDRQRQIQRSFRRGHVRVRRDEDSDRTRAAEMVRDDRRVTMMDYLRYLQSQPSRVEDAPRGRRRRRRAPRRRPRSAGGRGGGGTTPTTTTTTGRRRAVFIGDSITAGLSGGNGIRTLSGWREEAWARANVEVVADGHSGWSSSRLLERMQQHAELRRHIRGATEIFIEAGANNIGWGAAQRRRLNGLNTQLGRLRQRLESMDEGDARTRLEQRISTIETQINDAIQARFEAVRDDLRQMYHTARQLNPNIRIIAVTIPPMFGYSLSGGGSFGVLEERARMMLNDWIRERVEAGDIPGLETVIDMDRHFLQDPDSTEADATVSVDGRTVSARRADRRYVVSDGVHHNRDGIRRLLGVYATGAYPLRRMQPRPAVRPTPAPPRVTDEQLVREGQMPAGVRLR